MDLHPIQKTFYFLAISFLIVLVMHYGSFLLIPVIYGIFLAIIINPFVSYFMRYLRFHILSFILTIVALLLLIILPVSFVINQVGNLFSKLNVESMDVDTVTKSIQDALMNTSLSKVVDLNLLKDQMGKILGVLGDFATTLVSSSSTMMINFALAILFSYFLSAYYDDVRKIVMKELEADERSKWRSIADKAPDIIRSYLSGMLIVMLILAVLNGLALFIIGLDYAFVWGLIIGMLAIIPYAGTFVGLMLPLTYSFISTNDYKQPLIIFIVYLVIQQIEGNLLTPKIVGDKLKINPFIIILMILIFGKIWGLDGVIISLPLIGVIKTILQEYEKGQLWAKLISSKS
ncbi:MAG: AI-2E family transporter [Saprospiraceae bacterium]|nr:AI-2E family transporter [Saprospiraceae bacterium]